uniref:Secreted protein n=1 Tax=Anopheles merus TaxID=30066 RepID=A0A182VAL2_ANOME
MLRSKPSGGRATLMAVPPVVFGALLLLLPPLTTLSTAGDAGCCGWGPPLSSPVPASRLPDGSPSPTSAGSPRVRRRWPPLVAILFRADRAGAPSGAGLAAPVRGTVRRRGRPVPRPPLVARLSRFVGELGHKERSISTDGRR